MWPHFLLWTTDFGCHNQDDAHKLVVPCNSWIHILQAMHDNLCYRDLFATWAVLLEQFKWPQVTSNIAWYIQTCHICQIQQTIKVLILPTITTPATLLFRKIYIDTVHMPLSNSFKYIIQSRCTLILYPEFCMLPKENTKEIYKWTFFATEEHYVKSLLIMALP